MADTKISDLAAVTDLIGTDEYVLARAGDTKKIDASDLATEILALASPSGGGLFDAYALLRDEKTAGTNGGTFTTGAWRTRDLNTEATDPGGIVTLSANQFTLLAGSYWIYARAPAAACLMHKAKLRNITDSTDDLVGSSSYTANTVFVQTDSVVQGRVTLAGTKVFEIQHNCGATKTTDGFGAQNGLGVVEVYTEVEIWREA